MRLFVAIDLDEKARLAIAVEQRRLAKLSESASPLRWVRPERLHLTLAFLGEINEAQASEVTRTLSKPIEQPPFEIAFEGLGVFPSRGAPRALWVGLSRGGAEMLALGCEIANGLTRAGLVLDDRSFSPHLTLARWKRSRPSDRACVLSAARPGLLARVDVECASLYLSRLSSAGPSYTELARANLTARG